ncbi:hypothetical protein [Nisaea sp.]|uniref:hypothetical protein n=1 Tax=Nisaea sp. TaxID=2024842 RepID=UPI0032977B44
MTTQKARFLFDNIFDEEYQEKMRRAAEAARMAELEAEEHAPPTYTQEEVDEAKEASYQLGRQEGMSSAMAGIEQQVSVSLEGVLSKVGELSQVHRQWTAEIQRDAVRLAATIMRKMAPELTRGTELPQIEHVINQAFQFLTEQPKVMIRVAAELEAPLRDKVQLMASRVGYEGEVVLVGDPELVATDCRVSWAAGAVERALDETWGEIDEMVERTLSSLPARSDIGSDMPSEPASETTGDIEIEIDDQIAAKEQSVSMPETTSDPAIEEHAADDIPAHDLSDAVPETLEESMDADGDPSEAELIQN